MIVELRVENLAIIESAQLAFGAGFTALTGETGAGKSLLIDAMQLALGGRADLDLIRHGASRASVTMVVATEGLNKVVEAADALGVPHEKGYLTVVREISEGRSSAKINGRAVPISGLKSLGNALVDLHGQHDHQALLDPEKHVEYLDAWIGERATLLKEGLSSLFALAQSVRTKLDGLRRGKRDVERRLDLLRFQIAEIEKFEPTLGESLELEAKIERLRHAEKISSSVSEAIEGITDGEVNAADQAASAAKVLQSALRFDPSLGEWLSPIEEAVVQLREASHGLRNYLEALENDPELLDVCVERLDGLKRLFRKYGDDEAAVLVFADEARRDLEDLTFGEVNEEELVADLDRLEAELKTQADALTTLRIANAEKFAAGVEAGLRELAMDRAQFEIAIRTSGMTPTGQDAVEFLFSANAGEPPRGLAPIASGGELSRTMLAIKSELAQRAGANGGAGVPTLIFDEVDSGLGGRAAAAVARKLRALASGYQVLVISHLPQIASQADAHFRIEKVEKGGRVLTRILPLEGEERVEEIARMLAGDEITAPALANARDLMLGS
jgi:DNA repair protein RecN (Recombination protein N)